MPAQSRDRSAGSQRRAKHWTGRSPSGGHFPLRNLVGFFLSWATRSEAKISLRTPSHGSARSASSSSMRSSLGGTICPVRRPEGRSLSERDVRRRRDSPVATDLPVSRACTRQRRSRTHRRVTHSRSPSRRGGRRREPAFGAASMKVARDHPGELGGHAESADAGGRSRTLRSFRGARPGDLSGVRSAHGAGLHRGAISRLGDLEARRWSPSCAGGNRRRATRSPKVAGTGGSYALQEVWHWPVVRERVVRLRSARGGPAPRGRRARE